jgi:Fe-S oxidoreductase
MIPYTKFVHLLSLPTNVFFSKLKPRGELQRPDIEKLMESADDADLKIGLQTAEELTWKQRMDLDTCVSCGRCDEVCPAYMADKEYFAPRQLIARIKKSLDELGTRRNGDGKEIEDVRDIVGKAFDEEFIWHCRTCGACMEVCPALIDHVDTLMEIRRNEVLIQGRMPEEAGRALRLYETNGNPFGPQSERTDWIKQMGVRVVGPGEKVEVLYWIGCCVTFDPQKHKIAEDLCALMTKCGIDYGVLGDDEKCCGDPARLMGQEMLFQQTAKEQVEILKQREFKILLTGCPHCYNVLKHEYKQFGGDFNVMHHSEYIHEMLYLDMLKPQSGAARKYVYHDPCYLGRYQRIFDASREIVKAIPNSQLLEMKNRREKSLCCGAGGGHYWMDLKRGERINNLRVKQAQAAGADTIVTACAYCMHMLQDSVKLLNCDETMRVIDVASLTAASLEQTKK